MRDDVKKVKGELERLSEVSSNEQKPGAGGDDNRHLAKESSSDITCGGLANKEQTMQDSVKKIEGELKRLREVSSKEQQPATESRTKSADGGEELASEPSKLTSSEKDVSMKIEGAGESKRLSEVISKEQKPATETPTRSADCSSKSDGDEDLASEPSKPTSSEKDVSMEIEGATESEGLSEVISKEQKSPTETLTKSADGDEDIASMPSKVTSSKKEVEGAAESEGLSEMSSKEQTLATEATTPSADGSCKSSVVEDAASQPSRSTSSEKSSCSDKSTDRDGTPSADGSGKSSVVEDAASQPSRSTSSEKSSCSDKSTDRDGTPSADGSGKSSGDKASEPSKLTSSEKSSHSNDSRDEKQTNQEDDSRLKSDSDEDLVSEPSKLTSSNSSSQDKSKDEKSTDQRSTPSDDDGSKLSSEEHPLAKKEVDSAEVDIKDPKSTNLDAPSSDTIGKSDSAEIISKDSKSTDLDASLSDHIGKSSGDEESFPKPTKRTPSDTGSSQGEPTPSDTGSSQGEPIAKKPKLASSSGSAEIACDSEATVDSPAASKRELWWGVDP